MSDEMTTIQIAIAAVPVVIALISTFIGSKQVREFHRRTGDHSVLSHVAGFSSYDDDAECTKAHKA